MRLLKQAYDVVVVGAGIIGMMTARELARAGQRVLILERGAAGQESSWAGGGILSPLYPWRYPSAVSVLARWGHEHYEAICRDLLQTSGIDPEWVQSGLLVLNDEVELEEARNWAATYDMHLLHWRAAEVHASEPNLGYHGDALWLPDIAQVRNPRMVKALARYCEVAGIEIRTGVEVTEFNVSAGQLRGLETSQGPVVTERVVLCGGAWSAGLVPGLAVEPVKGQMLVFAAEPGLVGKIVLADGRYVIPRRDGHVLVGSTLEHSGFDKATSDEARESLLETAFGLYPGLHDYPVERHWAGLRPGSPQGIPTIGPHPTILGLYINAGHYRNGVIIGAASARLMADLILGREAVVAPTPYALNGGM